MLVREFSQKNSVALFYATIVLIILVVVLGFISFGHKGSREFNPGNLQGRNQQGMMQDNNVSVPDQNVQSQTPDQVPVQTPDQTQ
jgi:regulatory protein YycI of two-component signal transduction system YycFG